MPRKYKPRSGRPDKRRSNHESVGDRKFPLSKFPRLGRGDRGQFIAGIDGPRKLSSRISGSSAKEFLQCENTVAGNLDHLSAERLARGCTRHGYHGTFGGGDGAKGENAAGQMLGRRDDQDGAKPGAIDHLGERSSLAQGSESPFADPLALHAVLFDVDEEVSLGSLDGLHHLDEAAVAPQPELAEASPFEAAHAENETRGEARLEELEPDALSIVAASEDEDRVGGLGLPADVEKRRK